MASNQEKQLRMAERLLAQGRTQEAVHKLDQLSRGGPAHALTLNRLGDLLTRAGETEKAVRFYVRIADEFAGQGLYPKAAAIAKKILRLDPSNTANLIRLAELYAKQQLPAEARAFLMRAAGLHLERQDFAEARKIYERLIRLEPEDPLHRARLAETRAAEGDTNGACDELLALGHSLFESGRPEEAEKAYRRAGELLGERPEPVLGLVRCLTETGRDDEARSLLERSAVGESAPSEILGELFVRYELGGEEGKARAMLERAEGRRLPDESFCTVLRYRLDRDEADRFWEALGPVFATWAENGERGRVARLYDSLGDAEPDGHLPALERLLELYREASEKEALGRTLTQLVRAYRVRSLEAKEQQTLKELQEVDPRSPLVAEGAADDGARGSELAGGIEEAGPVTPIGLVNVDGQPPIEVEAPAVPLTRADEEFVAGRMTQAEILEKYGLLDQALGQVREVSLRFPGIVEVQRRLASLLRDAGESGELQGTLVRLALACRAAGNPAEGREAAEEAVALGDLDVSTLSMLEQLGLCGAEPEPPRQGAQAPAAVEVPESVRKAAAPKATEPVLIDFNEEPGEEESPPTEKAAAPIPVAEVAPAESRPEAGATPAEERQRIPGSEMLEEVRTYLANGMVAEARQRVAALQRLGYGGQALEALQREVEGGSVREPTVETPREPAAEQPVEVAASSPSDEDDLGAITAALENELFDDDVPVAVPEEKEQSIEEVFAAFKERVVAEVDSGDYRTHYDLGIAYKEMGLLDGAIEEFLLALRSRELHGESCVMLALCHREQEGMEDAAADWYRRAIEAHGDDPAAQAVLRYELAELLLEAGQRAAALDLFRDLMAVDPRFRDVSARVTELETSSTPS